MKGESSLTFKSLCWSASPFSTSFESEVYIQSEKQNENEVKSQSEKQNESEEKIRGPERFRSHFGSDFLVFFRGELSNRVVLDLIEFIL
jgi:hypothetical protein